MREWHISIPRSIDDKELSAPQALSACTMLNSVMV